MSFWGREREKALITKTLSRGENLVVTGKWGIGKTSLIREVAKINGERWRFLFTDFSKPPSRICHDLLKALRPANSLRRSARDPNYKQCRSIIVDLISNTKRPCVIVLDNIEKLTGQKLDLIRYLAWDKPCLFIAILDPWLPKDDLWRLRAPLYPSKIIKIGYLSTKTSERFFRDYAERYRLHWTESDIRLLALTAKGYPLAMKERVARELQGVRKRI